MYYFRVAKCSGGKRIVNPVTSEACSGLLSTTAWSSSSMSVGLSDSQQPVLTGNFKTDHTSVSTRDHVTGAGLRMTRVQRGHQLYIYICRFRSSFRRPVVSIQLFDVLACHTIKSDNCRLCDASRRLTRPRLSSAPDFILGSDRVQRSILPK